MRELACWAVHNGGKPTFATDVEEHPEASARIRGSIRVPVSRRSWREKILQVLPRKRKKWRDEILRKMKKPDGNAMQYVFAVAKRAGVCSMGEKLDLSPNEFSMRAEPASICAIFPISWESQRTFPEKDKWLQFAMAAHERCTPSAMLGIGTAHPLPAKHASWIAYHLSSAVADARTLSTDAKTNPTLVAETLTDWLYKWDSPAGPENLLFVGNLTEPINLPPTDDLSKQEGRQPMPEPVDYLGIVLKIAEGVPILGPLLAGPTLWAHDDAKLRRMKEEINLHFTRDNQISTQKLGEIVGETYGIEGDLQIIAKLLNRINQVILGKRGREAVSGARPTTLTDAQVKHIKALLNRTLIRMFPTKEDMKDFAVALLVNGEEIPDGKEMYLIISKFVNRIIGNESSAIPVLQSLLGMRKDSWELKEVLRLLDANWDEGKE
jgi:hypothetical protein